MIDISDGLLLDLGRITVDRGLGALISADKLPLSGGYKSIVSDCTEGFYELALSGGEDYELLFTSPEGNRESVTRIASVTGADITEIGIVNSGTAIEVVGSKGEEIKLNRRGFVHFG